MRYNLIFLITFICISISTGRTKSIRQPKIKLSKNVKKAFKQKQNFYLYRSLVTGQKWGISKVTKKRFEQLNLLHLMTPSGLHLSSFFLLLLLFKRFKFYNKLKALELVCCLSLYFFLPGYYSLRRIALLRSLFILNSYRGNLYKKETVFILFIIIDFLFGTFRYNQISFFLSMLFLSLIFSIKEFRFYKMYLLFFIGQLFIAHKFSGFIYPLTIISSPLLTMVFTFIYPLIFTNIFFIEYINFAEPILEAYKLLVTRTYELTTSTQFIHVNFIMLIGVIIYSKKLKKISVALITCGTLINLPRDSFFILTNEIIISLREWL